MTSINNDSIGHIPIQNAAIYMNYLLCVAIF